LYSYFKVEIRKNRIKNAGAEIPNVVNLFEGDHHDCSPVKESHLSPLAHSWYALAESTPYIPLGKE
jgi:hypothetical protein